MMAKERSDKAARKRARWIRWIILGIVLLDELALNRINTNDKEVALIWGWIFALFTLSWFVLWACMECPCATVYRRCCAPKPPVAYEAVVVV